MGEQAKTGKELNGQMVGSSGGNTDGICRLGEARAEVTELREKVGSGEKRPGKGRRGPQGVPVSQTPDRRPFPEERNGG